MAAAEDLWCQGWSEPGAGSDLAGITQPRRARRGAGGWRLSGQKTWTTRGAFCTHLFGLFRTDPNAERHRGLTYFLVPLDTPGVTVRGFERLDGDEGFAEVFFDNVFVPDSAVLGEVDQGWKVAMATTGSERGLTLRSPGRFLEAAKRLVDARRSEHSEAATDPLMRPGGRSVDARPGVPTVHPGAGHRHRRRAATGRARQPQQAVLVRARHRAARDARSTLLGPAGRADNRWSRGFQFSLAGPIYAGTNEIQRNIVAERVLGLPRK